MGFDFNVEKYFLKRLSSLLWIVVLGLIDIYLIIFFGSTHSLSIVLS